MREARFCSWAQDCTAHLTREAGFGGGQSVVSICCRKPKRSEEVHTRSGDVTTSSTAPSQYVGGYGHRALCIESDWPLCRFHTSLEAGRLTTVEHSRAHSGLPTLRAPAHQLTGADSSQNSHMRTSHGCPAVGKRFARCRMRAYMRALCAADPRDESQPVRTPGTPGDAQRLFSPQPEREIEFKNLVEHVQR